LRLRVATTTSLSAAKPSLNVLTFSEGFTETEVDDGAAYEIEIRREDGSEVEVHLNKNCQVIGQEADDD
jgi:hypothetical protein